MESPHYGTAYPDDYNYVYDIHTEPGRPCLVTIVYDAGIEYSTDCVYDKLIINADAPDVLVFCGNTDGNATYQCKRASGCTWSGLVMVGVVIGMIAGLSVFICPDLSYRFSGADTILKRNSDLSVCLSVFQWC